MRPEVNLMFNGHFGLSAPDFLIRGCILEIEQVVSVPAMISTETEDIQIAKANEFLKNKLMFSIQQYISKLRDEASGY